jgi:hypothetical protein
VGRRNILPARIARCIGVAVMISKQSQALHLVLHEGPLVSQVGTRETVLAEADSEEHQEQEKQRQVETESQSVVNREVDIYS